MSDLDLDKDADWSPSSAEGVERQLRASCVLGCLEIVMGHEVETAGETTGRCILDEFSPRSMIGSPSPLAPLPPATALGWTEEGRSMLHQAFELHAIVFESSRKASKKKKAAKDRGRGADKENTPDPMVRQRSLSLRAQLLPETSFESRPATGGGGHHRHAQRVLLLEADCQERPLLPGLHQGR